MEPKETICKEGNSGFPEVQLNLWEKVRIRLARRLPKHDSYFEIKWIALTTYWSLLDWKRTPPTSALAEKFADVWRFALPHIVTSGITPWVMHWMMNCRKEAIIKASGKLIVLTVAGDGKTGDHGQPAAMMRCCTGKTHHTSTHQVD